MIKRCSLLFVILFYTAFIFSQNKTPIRFIGEYERNGNNLRWQIENRDNFAYFIVEKAQPNGYYVELSERLMPNVATINEEFTYRDGTPYSGKNSYRIRMVRPDDTFNFSDVVEVYVENLPDVYAYPQPADDFVNLEIVNFDLTESAVGRILNNNGNVVWQRDIFPDSFIKLWVNVGNFQPGIYQFQIMDEDYFYTEELVIR